jgi:hypothetical protein
MLFVAQRMKRADFERRTELHKEDANLWDPRALLLYYSSFKVSNTYLTHSFFNKYALYSTLFKFASIF